MDNTINNDIIEKVTIKSVAIYKAIAMLPPIETKDLWEEKNSIEHQKNYENKNVSETNDTMKNTKMPSTPNDWRDITDPKLRRKMRLKAWEKDNKDKIKLRKTQYYKNNDSAWNKRREYIKTWKNNKRKNDINYKLSCSLRERVSRLVRTGSAVKDLGCTVEELKSHLESKFQFGMSWDNYGLYGWHIDHIKPLASFDLTDRKQLLEACHYTNLQPLWAKDNLLKSDTVV